jgi:hypothetical protein
MAQCTHELIRVSETSEVAAIDWNECFARRTEVFDIRLCGGDGNNMVVAALDDEKWNRHIHAERTQIPSPAITAEDTS